MISNLGIYQISADEYHADPCPEPSLSSSIANVLLNQSPAHAWQAHPRLNPDYKPDEDSRFDLGSAAHALLLERDDSRFVWVEANDWRTSYARSARIDARAQGKLPILAHHQGVLRRMVEVASEAIARTELAGIFEEGQPEQTVVWKEGDAWCRARLDWLTPCGSIIGGDRIIMEYKTSESAEPEQFIRQIGRMGYDLQAEFYRRGVKAINGTEPDHVMLAQEITEPFACSLVSLANSYREIAQAKVERAITCWRMCLQANSWPAYSTRIHYAEPPSWVLAEYESRMTTKSGDWQ